MCIRDSLSSARVEVDMIKFSGPAFPGVDNRLMALQLVQQWLTEAAMFTADGETVIPGELLWKKPVLLERGSFRPLTNPMLDMLERGREQFVADKSLQNDPPVVMFEMTLRQLQIGDAIDHQDFLDRVDTLGALGKPVLISNFFRYHRLEMCIRDRNRSAKRRSASLSNFQGSAGCLHTDCSRPSNRAANACLRRAAG